MELKRRVDLSLITGIFFLLRKLMILPKANLPIGLMKK